MTIALSMAALVMSGLAVANAFRARQYRVQAEAAAERAVATAERAKRAQDAMREQRT